MSSKTQDELRRVFDQAVERRCAELVEKLRKNPKCKMGCVGRSTCMALETAEASVVSVRNEMGRRLSSAIDRRDIAETALVDMRKDLGKANELQMASQKEIAGARGERDKAEAERGELAGVLKDRHTAQSEWTEQSLS